jgi:hypothetical protein
MLSRSRIVRPAIFALISLGLDQAVQAAPAAMPAAAAGIPANWNGFEQRSFTSAGCAAWVIVPAIAAPGKPWVWRTTDPDRSPGAALELVRNGWHVGYVDLPEPSDPERSLAAMDAFYAAVTSQWQLAPKPALESSGRSGPVAARYAALHPERVAGLAAESPGADAGRPAPSDYFGAARAVMDRSYPLPAAREYYRLRDGLDNSRARFERDRRGRVVFFGGSITFNPGWRDEVMRYLRLRFPETQFDFVAAGIPSLGSVPHAFRLEQDVLSGGPVDLIFVEAAVNDHNYDDYPNRTELARRGLEGVVRHLRMANPLTDIVELHFADDRDLKTYHAGGTSYVIDAHERVAAAYGCPSLDLSREVADRIDAHEFTWLGDFRDIHPSPYGQLVYSLSITRMLDAAWAGAAPLAQALRPHPLGPPLDPLSYFHGRWAPLTAARRVRGFSLDPAWHPTDGSPTRDGFVDVPALVGTQPGAEFAFDFNGRGVGLLVTSGPDAGVVESSVDGGPWRRTDTFTVSSPSLHLPWAIILDDALAPGRHTLRVRISPDRNPKSLGHALRVQRLLLN